MSDTDDLARAIGPRPISYRRPAYRKVPSYRAIVFGSWVLQLAAILFGIPGLIMAVAGATALFNSSQQNPRPATAVLSFAPVVTGCSLIAAGVLLDMLAWIAVAIRDIAINSFRE